MIMVWIKLKQMVQVNTFWVIFLGPLRSETQWKRAALSDIHLVLCEIIHYDFFFIIILVIREALLFTTHSYIALIRLWINLLFNFDSVLRCIIFGSLSQVEVV